MKYYNSTYKQENGNDVIKFYTEPIPIIDQPDISSQYYASQIDEYQKWQSSIKTAIIRDEDKEAIEKLVFNLWDRTTSRPFEGFKKLCKQGIYIQSLEDKIEIVEKNDCASPHCMCTSLKCNKVIYTASLKVETKVVEKNRLFTEEEITKNVC